MTFPFLFVSRTPVSEPAIRRSHGNEIETITYFRCDVNHSRNQLFSHSIHRYIWISIVSRCWDGIGIWNTLWKTRTLSSYIIITIAVEQSSNLILPPYFDFAYIFVVGWLILTLYHLKVPITKFSASLNTQMPPYFHSATIQNSLLCTIYNTSFDLKPCLSWQQDTGINMRVTYKHRSFRDICKQWILNNMLSHLHASARASNTCGPFY